MQIVYSKCLKSGSYNYNFSCYYDECHCHRTTCVQLRTAVTGLVEGEKASRCFCYFLEILSWEEDGGEICYWIRETVTLLRLILTGVC